MKTLARLFFVILLVSLMQYGFANDTVARLGIGGLEITKTNGISMDEEILEISLTKIRVEYKFRNLTSKDITTLVAFPMPRLRYLHEYDNSPRDPVKNFHTWVNQQPIQTQIDTQAFLNGRNITTKLKAMGLNEEWLINHVQCDIEVAIEHKACIEPRIVKALPSIVAKGEAETPEYQVQQTMWWAQRFAANSVTSIVHEYEPFIGGRGISDSLDIASDPSSDAKPPRDIACTKENGIASRVENLIMTSKARYGGDHIWQREVEYILGTGRNWQGRTIKDFTLRIKKDKPSQVVSLCFPTPAIQVDQLTLEYKQKNFVPQDKLVIYFFSSPLVN